MDQELSKVNLLRGEENWAVWKFQVRVLMKASEAYSVVDGSEVRPQLQLNPTAEQSSAHRKALKAWDKLDGMAQKIIATTMGEKSLLHIINCTSANEMWIKLHEIYENKNQTSIHILLQQWFSLQKNAADSISTHIAKVKDLAHRLELLGERISEGMIITKLLMSLPSTYTHFITAWESTTPNDRNLANLTVRLTMEEVRNSAYEKQSDEAFTSQKWGKKNSSNNSKSSKE